MRFATSRVLRQASLAAAVSLSLLSLPAQAAVSGSFVFDFVGDAGDNADGPQYDVTLVGPTNDNGLNQDLVIMVMVDATGTPLDVDPMAISGTTGSDDGDYGVINTATAGPITYALFDIDQAAANTLLGISEGSPSYMAFLLANSSLLDQQTLAFDGVPVQAPFLFGSQSVPVGGTAGLGALGLTLLGLSRRQGRSKAIAR